MLEFVDDEDLIELRMFCIEKALDFFGPDEGTVNHKQVVKTAKKFEKYILRMNEEKETS
jgi:hypothetical protein